MDIDVPTNPEEARILLKRVIARCPHQHDDDPDCHLCAYKHPDEATIAATVDAMSDEEVVRQCRRHDHCFWSKLGDR